MSVALMILLLGLGVWFLVIFFRSEKLQIDSPKNNLQPEINKIINPLEAMQVRPWPPDSSIEVFDVIHDDQEVRQYRFSDDNLKTFTFTSGHVFKAQRNGNEDILELVKTLIDYSSKTPKFEKLIGTVYFTAPSPINSQSQAKGRLVTLDIEKRADYNDTVALFRKLANDDLYNPDKIGLEKLNQPVVTQDQCDYVC